MNKKIILLYPYYNGKSGAYNRYLLLKELVNRINKPVKLIVINEKRYNSNFIKLFNKLIRFFMVESIMFYYSIFKNFYFITDFNPSFVALFSKKVYIQIHDLSWENRKFARHHKLSYKLLLFFLRNYSNILTVSKTSEKAIKRLSGRKKRINVIYNSVDKNYINKSKEIAKNDSLIKNKFVLKNINLNVPNIIYIATLTPRKCHLDLLEVLSNINFNLNINLIGYPTDKNIEELIKRKITSKGTKIKSNINYFPILSQKELCTLLLFSSAYVSTSMSEGFGIPILEAKFYDLPLIIRDIDINRELFPGASFFKSKHELMNLLSKIKPLNTSQLKKRKNILKDINEDNLMGLFNYSVLSKKLNKLFS